jgi:hypothetical protein
VNGEGKAKCPDWNGIIWKYKISTGEWVTDRDFSIKITPGYTFFFIY